MRQFYTGAEGLPADQIRSLAVTREGLVIVAASNSVSRLEGDRWNAVNGPAGVTSLFAPCSRTSCARGSYEWHLGFHRRKVEPGTAEPRTVMCFAAEPGGIVWAMAPSGVWRRENGWKLVNSIEDDVMAQPHAFLPRGSMMC